MSRADDDNLERDPLKFLPAERHEVTLHPKDAAALDEIADGVSAEASRVEAGRRARVEQWLKVLDKAHGTPAPANLAAATLVAVEKCRERDEADARAESLKVRRFYVGRRFWEMASVGVAAALLLVVLIPGVASARQRAKQTQCTANLSGMGKALGTYAASNNNALPALAASADGSWLSHEGLRAGSGHSNTANLFPLVRAGYVDKDKLVCPGRDITATPLDVMKDEIPDMIRGYSYFNMSGPAPHWGGPPLTIVLADRSPLFAREGPGGPAENSMNHDRTGTNVLNTAGTVEWVTTPDVGPNKDNIWTITTMPRGGYTGREHAASMDDAFLSP